MGDFKNRGKVTGAGFKNRGSVIAGGSFTNRGAEDQSGRPFQNRGQDWFGGAFKNRGQTLLESFTPSQLFAASEVGVWYDPSDLSTMFQNSNGTTAVAVGDPVGYIADKSGNGFHATQATAGSRPVLRQSAGGLYYLEFDGTDDSLVTSAIDFSSANEMSVFIGYSKLSDAATGVLVELSADTASNNGSFALFAPLGSASFMWRSKGTVIADAATGVNEYLSPTTKVLCGIGDISADSSILRANGAVEQNTTTDQGTGNYGNYPLYIGRRNNASLPVTGNLYSLIVRGALSSASEIASAEAYVNSKTGAY